MSAVPLQPLARGAAVTLAGKVPGDSISLIQLDPPEGWVSGLTLPAAWSGTGGAVGGWSPWPEVPVPRQDEPRSQGEMNPTLHLLLADLCCAQIMNGDSVLPNQKKTPNPAAFKLVILQLLGANRNHRALLVQNICGAAK